METRARYALIGLFMLAVIAASFAFVYWLENKGGFAERETYQIKFQGSVSGLLIGSAVLFNGIRVGEVTDLGLYADAPQDVVATIAVSRGTPIRADTAVNIETQGLTGGAAVALRGGSSTAPLVTAEGGAPPTLIAQPQAGQDWTQAARDAFQRVDKVLADNSEALKSAIANIDTFSQALARNSDKVDGILAGFERMTGGGTNPADDPGLRSRRRHDRFAPCPRRAAELALGRARADHAHGLQHRQDSVAAFRGRERARRQCAMGRQRAHPRAVQGGSELRECGLGEIGEPRARWRVRRLSTHPRHPDLPDLQGLGAGDGRDRFHRQADRQGRKDRQREHVPGQRPGRGRRRASLCERDR